LRIPDANVLLYASDSSSRHHRAAREWVERALSASETVGFPMVVLLAFVRVSTSARVMATPLPPGAAFDQVEEWLAQPSAVLLHPGRRHIGLWRELTEASGTAGNLTTDAHLAAPSFSDRRSD
jgi:uncharacterized protein